MSYKPSWSENTNGMDSHKNEIEKRVEEMNV